MSSGQARCSPVLWIQPPHSHCSGLLDTHIQPRCACVDTYASRAMTMPAQTSQAQQPISQYASRQPIATCTKLRAAEPIERTPRAISPPSMPVCLSPTRRLYVRDFFSITSADLSEPHSKAIKACLNEGSGCGVTSGRGRRSGCNGVVINAPWPFLAAHR